MDWDQRRFQNLGIGRRKGRCGVLPPSQEELLKFSEKNYAFLCKIVTIFEMHLINRGRSPRPSPLNPLLTETPSDFAEMTLLEKKLLTKWSDCSSLAASGAAERARWTSFVSSVQHCTARHRLRLVMDGLLPARFPARARVYTGWAS